jgi:hypothetical protein
MQAFTGSEVHGSRVTVKFFLVSFVFFGVIFFLWNKNCDLHLDFIEKCRISVSMSCYKEYKHLSICIVDSTIHWNYNAFGGRFLDKPYGMMEYWKLGRLGIKSGKKFILQKMFNLHSLKIPTNHIFLICLIKYPIKIWKSMQNMWFESQFF